MTSTLDVLITRFLGISSILLLFGNQFVVGSRLSLTLQTPASLKSADVMFDFCASNLCSFEPSTAKADQAGGKSINAHPALYIFSHVLSERETEHAQINRFAAYTPPACDNTDSDQSNNCGPNDSGDAGTRLAV